MIRYYANLLGEWVDITEDATVEHGHDVPTYFEDNYKAFERFGFTRTYAFDYVLVEYQGCEYRIHPSMIQKVTRPD